MNTTIDSIPAQRAVLLSTAHYHQRIRTVQERIEAQGLEGLLLLNAANVMWASGFFHIANERPLGLYIPRQGSPYFLAALLEKENVESNWIGDVRCYLEFPGEVPAEVWMMQQIGATRSATDGASHRTFEQMRTVKPSLRLDDTVTKLRYLKSPEEIELTRMAAEYADFGLEVARRAVGDGLRSGITELDVVQIVQSETTAKMKHELADLINFYRGAVALTAHTGPRAALPHGQPGPVAIQPGDALIVGIGVRVGGYHAESGCTFVLSQPSADQLRCLRASWECDEAAFAALKPGTTCSSVNEAAWAVLRDYGYGDFIRHRIGHGMGIEGHEAPWLSVGDSTRLEPTMIFSNEPGIYRPGVDGYRIIDSMLVTEHGGERLSRYLSAHGPEDRII